VLTCVLVEDDPLLRELLTEVLQSHPATEMLGSVGTAAEGIDLCLQQKPDLLVLDLNLPDGNGLLIALDQARAQLVLGEFDYRSLELQLLV
jgi:DNA-binding NarL/FixJ family response regulator